MFAKFGGGFTQGLSNELRFEGVTANTNTGGSLTLSQDSIFDVTAIFFERAGGDFFEIAIFDGATTSIGPGPYSIIGTNTFSGTVLIGQSAFDTTQSVAEPGTLALFGLSLAGLGYMRRRRVC